MSFLALRVKNDLGINKRQKKKTNTSNTRPPLVDGKAHRRGRRREVRSIGKAPSNTLCCQNHESGDKNSYSHPPSAGSMLPLVPWTAVKPSWVHALMKPRASGLLLMRMGSV